MTTTCIIPARGNSKCLPRKNLREVHGIPLVVRAIRAAQQGGCDRVIVSTEDDEIAAVALEAGAEVHARPHELASDTASSESVLVDACQACDVSEGVLVFAQCTSPLTRPQDVRDCADVVKANPLAVAVTAVPFHAPVWRENGPRSAPTGLTHDETKPRQRRQDMPTTWRETGAVYAMGVRRFLQARHRFCGPVIPVFQQGWQGVDIDDEDDLAVANALALRHDVPPDFSRFKALVLDFDGVLTDDTVLCDSVGGEAVRCCKADSVGIARLLAQDIPVHVLTNEMDECVAWRCDKLRVGLTQTSEHKEWVLSGIVRGMGATLSETIFVGNDANDVEAMRLCGLACCPADAHPSAKVVADLVLRCNGGDGAVREICEAFLGGA